MAATYEKDTLTYMSKGETITADFYRPTSQKPEAGWPVIVGASGFGGVKEMVIPSFAVALAGIGIASVVPDYIGFGASTGEPRQDVQPWQQIDTLADTLAFVAADNRFDAERIALLGTSLGGAHSIVLASREAEKQPTQRHIKCALVIIPHISVATNILDFARLFPAIAADTVGRVLLRRAPRTIPSSGAPGAHAVMTTDGALDWMHEVTREAPLFKNEVTYASLLRMSRYDVKAYARKIRLPVLVVSAKDDQLTPAAKVHDAFSGVESATMRDFPGSHFGLFTEQGEELNEVIVNWFRAKL